jgi:hypothetical protein
MLVLQLIHPVGQIHSAGVSLCPGHEISAILASVWVRAR